MQGYGFALARSSSQVTLYDIVAVVDGTEQFDQCVVALATCDDDQPRLLHGQFKAIRLHIKSFLKSLTLDQMSRMLGQNMQLAGREVTLPKSQSKPLVGQST